MLNKTVWNKIRRERMNKHKFTIKSPFDELELACTVYEPEGSPKGFLQLVHGMAEHSARYQ